MDVYKLAPRAITYQFLSFCFFFFFYNIAFGELVRQEDHLYFTLKEWRGKEKKTINSSV